ncbi:flavin-containing monooxygenase [Nocardia sp. NPDC059240]|uniref:flavin-containing monooxygenase n=1 Tax=Nocardia sp. NPDC059240 TaxID=3346786 RepID=UPI003678A873
MLAADRCSGDLSARLAEGRKSVQHEQKGPVGAHEVDAVVVGGGMSGIRLTIALKKQGLHRIALLEKGEHLGGVWNHNRYPGVACDVPSPTYCFGFALNDWSRLYPPGAEIRDYFERIAIENDVVRHVRFGTELIDAAWDDSAKKWLCQTNKGHFRAQFLILASGVFSRESVPKIPGAEKFTGQSFHSMDWPTDFDPAGRRIAVVGTGASAIQFVPQIQPQVERLVVLQRTPPWIVPKPNPENKPVSRRRAQLRQRILRAFIYSILEMVVYTVKYPRLAALPQWAAQNHLNKQVSDPELRKALTPDYKAGCKRLLLSSDYYPAIVSSNVDYVPSALREIRENTVVATDGREFEVDTIIWGTGFDFGMRVFERVRGRDGRTLAERFAGTPRTYRGTTVVGCPNLFAIAGHNAGTASVPIGVEAQAEYVASAVRTMRARGFETVEPRHDAEETWVRRKDSELAGWIFNVGGCNSYYLNDKGVNVAAWPGRPSQMVRALRSFDIENYVAS